MVEISPVKPDRNKIDMSNDIIARLWAKHLGKSQDEIKAAIVKVGDNPDTVCKELGCLEALRRDDLD
jgi:hypothetical protein